MIENLLLASEPSRDSEKLKSQAQTAVEDVIQQSYFDFEAFTKSLRTVIPIMIFLVLAIYLQLQRKYRHSHAQR